MAHEVARGFGCRALFIERQESVMTLRRGFALRLAKAWWWWRTLTTGKSTREVMDVVRAWGRAGGGSLVDRSVG